MQQHLDTLSDIENSFDYSFDRAKTEKQYFEEQLEKLKQFQAATTKVEGLDQDDFKGVAALILIIKGEVESYNRMVDRFTESRKKKIMHYFKVRLSEVDLCQELKDYAAKYGFALNEIQLNQEARVSEHVNDLLFKARIYENDQEKVKAAQQELTDRARQLLAHKRHLIMLQSPTMDYDLDKVDDVLRSITEENQVILDAKNRFNEVVKTMMVNYAKRFISPSDMVPQILDILKQHGITPSTIENTPIVRQLKRPATEQSASVVNKQIEPKKPRNQQEALSAIKEAEPITQVVSQSEQTVDEIMPVVHVDQPVQVPEEQEAFSFSVEEQVVVEPMPHSAPVANKPSIELKKPANHKEALLAIREAHRIKCQQHVEKQKSLVDCMTELQTKNIFLEQFPLPNMDIHFKCKAQELAQTRIELNASYEQLNAENENLKSEIHQYVAQCIEKKDFNQDILQLIAHISQPIPQVVFQRHQTIDEPMPVVMDQPVPVPEEQEEVPFSVQDCATHPTPEQAVDEPMPVVEDSPVPEPEEQVDEDEYINVVDVDDETLLEPQGQVQEQVDVEPIPVVIDQPVPEEQEDVPVSVESSATHLASEKAVDKPIPAVNVYRNVPSSVETCAEVLGKMLTLSDRELRKKVYQRKLDPRITKIKHQLEMIDYVKKNLAPKQLTNQILDMLENKSPGPINLRNRETTLFDKRLGDLEILIKAEKQLDNVRSEIKESIDEAKYSMDRELTVYRDPRKAKEFEEIKSLEENKLRMILKDIEEKRKVYAAKYIAPLHRIKFIKDPEFPAVLAKKFAVAKKRKRLENVKNLGKRLKQLSEDLSNEYDQIQSSSQSTSTPVNVSRRVSRVRRRAPPKNKKVVVQVAEAENANADANDEQTDNDA